MDEMNARDTGTARSWFNFYRARGYQPLPSRPDVKRPFVRFGEWWESDAPEGLFEQTPTTNIQIMTGRHWRLLVIDLDGEPAIEQWKRLMPYCPRTWVTHSGGGGRHVWFSVAPDARPLPKAVLWRPDPSKPREKGEPAIERLCDRSLVIAPPSIHPRTGNRYRFLAGCSPKDVPGPAPVPARILGMKPLVAPRPVLSVVEERAVRRESVARPGEQVRTADVLAAIPDKTSLAKSWGLRFASDRPNHSGWCSCHAVGRKDDHPSASFRPDTGRYWEPDRGSLSFLDLSVLLGVYADWRDARDDLAVRYRARGIA